MRIVFFLWGTLLLPIAVAAFDPTELVLEKREGDIRFHHAATITSVTALSDGKRLLSTAQDGTARIWDIRTGVELHRFHHPGGEDVWDAQINHQGTELFTSGENKKIVRWNITSGKKIQTYDHGDIVFRLAISPDGKTLAATDRDDLTILWDIESGTKRHTLKGHSDSVYDVLFSADGETVITASDDDSLIRWGTENGQKIDSKKDSYGDVFSILPSPDQQSLLVCTEKASILALSFDLKKSLWNADLPSDVRTAAWSHDGTLAAAICDDEHLYILDGATGKTVRKIGLPTDSTWGVTFTQDDQKILCGCETIICTFEVASGNRLFPRPESVAVFTPPQTMLDLPKEDLQIEGNSPDGIILRDRNTGKVRQTWLQGKSVNTLAHSPDKKWIAAAGDDGAIWILDQVSGEELQTLHHGEDVNTIRFAEHGNMLLSGADDKKIKLWNTKTGALKKTLEGHTSYIKNLQISKDGSHLASNSYSDLRVWGLDGANLIQSHAFKTESLGQIHFSPQDDRSLLFIGSKCLYFWPYPESQERSTLKPHDIQRLIETLGAGQFRARAKATNKLIAAGQDILPFLREVGTDDPEISHRVQYIIRMLAQMNTYVTEDLFKLSLEKSPHCLAWHPDGTHWAAIEGKDANANLLFGHLQDKKLQVLHRINDGHSPSILFFTDENTLKVLNRDSSQAVYHCPTPK